MKKYYIIALVIILILGAVGYMYSVRTLQSINTVLSEIVIGMQESDVNGIIGKLDKDSVRIGRTTEPNVKIQVAYSGLFVYGGWLYTFDHGKLVDIHKPVQ